jgi:DNA-directed RNA polymerase subunit RPC12/RpoP
MKNNIQCPTCGRFCNLERNLNDIFIGKINSKICVDFLSYHCFDCSESFTTTEVDNINLKNINKGIRNFKRQLKIQKILK